MNDRSRAYVNGSWVPCQGSGSLPVVNPATEEPLGEVPVADAAMVDRAVEAARRALPGWSETLGEERAAHLRSAAEELRRQADDVADIITSELGSPLKISKLVHVDLPVSDLLRTAEILESPVERERLGDSVVEYEPVGVVACITPWNFPLHQLAAKIAGAVGAGCTVVAKPSELTTASAYRLADALHRARLPPGVVNFVPGNGAETGEALVSHPGIDMISFTGSTAAGRRISSLASASVRPLSLELGGKSPSVVLDDADLEAAVKGTVRDCMLNSGQVCSAFTRLIVPAARLREAEEVAVGATRSWVLGDPRDPATRMGPLVSAGQRARVRGYIEAGIGEGARLLAGGAARPEGLERGFFVSPTVFSDVTAAMRIAREEIFGPVLVIQAHEGPDDAVRLANDCDYGLRAGVWSGDPDLAWRTARRLRAGQVDVNGASFNPVAPFGGVKLSGYGRELGRFGIEEFLVTKSIQGLPAAAGA